MFVEPIEVLRKLELPKDSKAVDLGSGSGGWSLPLARILEDGEVVAVDVLEEPLSSLKGKARLEGLGNIRAVVGNAESNIVELATSGFDLVLMTNLLFQVDDKSALFRLAQRILKPGGRLLVVDWKKESLLAPKTGSVSPTEIKELAANFDFQIEKEFPAGDYHFALVFSKLWS